jgi:hypothetical protein
MAESRTVCTWCGLDVKCTVHYEFQLEQLVDSLGLVLVLLLTCKAGGG